MLNINNTVNYISYIKQNLVDKINQKNFWSLPGLIEKRCSAFFQSSLYVSELKNRIKPIIANCNFSKANISLNQETINSTPASCPTDKSVIVADKNSKAQSTNVATITRLAVGALVLAGVGVYVYNKLFQPSVVEDAEDKVVAEAAHAVSLYYDHKFMKDYGFGGAVHYPAPMIELPPTYYYVSEENTVPSDNYYAITASALIITGLAAMALSKFKSSCIEYCKSILAEDVPSDEDSLDTPEPPQGIKKIKLLQEVYQSVRETKTALKHDFEKMATKSISKAQTLLQQTMSPENSLKAEIDAEVYISNVVKALKMGNLSHAKKSAGTALRRIETSIKNEKAKIITENPNVIKITSSISVATNEINNALMHIANESKDKAHASLQNAQKTILSLKENNFSEVNHEILEEIGFSLGQASEGLNKGAAEQALRLVKALEHEAKHNLLKKLS